MDSMGIYLFCFFTQLGFWSGDLQPQIMSWKVSIRRKTIQVQESQSVCILVLNFVTNFNLNKDNDSRDYLLRPQWNEDILKTISKHRFGTHDLLSINVLLGTMNGVFSIKTISENEYYNDDECMGESFRSALVGRYGHPQVFF